MPISYYPAGNLVVFSGSSLSIDFADGDFANVSIDANGTLAPSNIPVGKWVYAEILNSHATDLVTITNPTASTWIIQKGLTTVSLLAGERVIAQMFYDGTNYRLIYGEVMAQNA